jgi:hypothetical protein
MAAPLLAWLLPMDIPTMSNPSLKSVALACKVLAILECVGLPLILRPRWGLDRIADVQLIGLAVLSLIPNRWLVFSRAPFVLFLVLTLFPFRDYFYISAYKDVDWASLIGGIFIGLFLFAPLPLSLVLSRMRFRRGDKFIYA